LGATRGYVDDLATDWWIAGDREPLHDVDDKPPL
jgi:hypothetical protein